MLAEAGSGHEEEGSGILGFLRVVVFRVSGSLPECAMALLGTGT